MDPETVKALIMAGASFGGVVVGAVVSWYATKAAEERKARREDDLAEKKEKRTHLQERLTLQKAAFTEYRRVLAKWADDRPPTVNSTITGTVQRWHTEDIESEVDSAAITRQIADAFSSPVFGEQTGMTIRALVLGRKDRSVAMVNQLWVSKCLAEMRRCIDALSEELGLPKPKVKPEPFIPADEFTRNAKRAVTKFEGERSGLDPKAVDAMLEKVGLGEAPPTAGSTVKPQAENVETEAPAQVEPVAVETDQQAAEDEARGVEEAVEAERQESVKSR